MTKSTSMPNDYLQLAKKRRETNWPNYSQPEDYGYDFKDWVSPYTKGSCTIGSIALVLQDWSSADSLSGGVKPGVQELGRAALIKTNRTLDVLLGRVFGLTIEEVYGTNVFPFIKQGKSSNYIPMRDIKQAALEFVSKELEIVKPTKILAFGKLAQTGLKHAKIDCIQLPHPAARGLSIYDHENIWRKKLRINDKQNPN